MTLDNFEYLVKFKYQIKAATEASKDMSLTDMFLALTGLTYLDGDIEELCDAFETDEEKEEFLDKLAWHIAGGVSTGDTAIDINKDTVIDDADVTAIEEIADKDEQTDEDLEKGDLNKDGVVDEKDVKKVKDNVKSKAEPETTTTEPVEPTESEEDNNEVGFTIVDHTNFAEAKMTILADYYNNYPTEDEQDGDDWPPFTASKFPWFVVNHKFDGNTTVTITYQNEEVFTWKPSAQVEREDGTQTPRTYIIASIPDDFTGMSEYVETVEGVDLGLVASDFKVTLTTETPEP